MVDQAVLMRKAAEVRRYVGSVRARLRDVETAAPSEEVRDLVAFHLLLAAQAAIDLATHFIADRGLAVPGSYRDAFHSLARAGLIDDALAERLADCAAVRNRIAHVYDSLDWRRLVTEAPAHLDALDAFLVAVAAGSADPSSSSP